ncbi:MAG: hypothetical protein GXY81_02165 [Candidatus Cloacimonetes bacterium]|nr:hypothetical protein [Candidatus Cloacimonadota bacterium]
MTAKYEQMEKMSPEEKFSAVANLKEKLEENFVTLGQLLSEIKRSRLFRVKGYENFREFVEAEYSLSGSLAGKLVAVFDVFIEEMDVDEATIMDIGFDRLQMIQPLVRKADWAQRDDWVQKAEEMPTRELRDHIKELKKEEKEKNLDPKKVFIDQFVERMTAILNCSRTELNFKLALYFQDSDTESIRDVVRQRQREFEGDLNKE